MLHSHLHEHQYASQYELSVRVKLVRVERLLLLVQVQTLVIQSSLKNFMKIVKYSSLNALQKFTALLPVTYVTVTSKLHQIFTMCRINKFKSNNRTDSLKNGTAQKQRT